MLVCVGIQVSVYMCVQVCKCVCLLTLNLTNSDRVTGWDYRSVSTMPGIYLVPWLVLSSWNHLKGGSSTEKMSL